MVNYTNVRVADYLPYEDDDANRRWLENVVAGVLLRIAELLVVQYCRKTGVKTDEHDNVVRGIGSDVESIVKYVHENVNLNGVYDHKQLPKHRIKLKRCEWDMILPRLRAEMVRLAIGELLEEGLIWPLDDDWLYSCELRVIYDRSHRMADRVFFDQRNWHGRPSRQGRRRARQLGLAPGMSIGAA